MPRAVSFPKDVEALVRFVEETPPERIAPETVRRLREGLSEHELMTAAALAVMRSTEMPYVHHGGPLHPVAALPAVMATTGRMPDRLRRLPLIQDVALANRHIHDPASGPALMPEMAPKGAGGVDATIGAFRRCLVRNYASAAEHHFLWLLEHAPEAAEEALVRVAVDNYRHDEHKLIVVVNTLRMLGQIGSRFAPVLLRGAVRYNFMPSVWAKAPGAEGVEALLQQYRLADRAEVGGGDPENRVDGFRMALAREPLEALPGRIALALHEGMSLRGAAEAISLAASDLFLGMETANAMGIHFMTGANAIRWVCENHPSLGARALLMWGLGPETLGARKSAPRPMEEAVPATLDAVSESVYANDGDQAASRAGGYLAANRDPCALLRLLAGFAAQDDATEMHAMKHHQAMAEEFESARPALASVHLVAQTKEAALHAGKGTGVFEQVREALER